MKTETPRPRHYDQAIILEAARECAGDVAEWLKGPVDEGLVTGLAEAMRQEAGNGYRMAKFLERKWLIEPDAELVEILDGCSTWSASRKAVAAWVAENGVKADLPAGTMVTFPRGVGEITGQDAEQATYTVWNEQVGGPREDRCGWIVAAEDCEVAQPRPSEAATTVQQIREES